MNIQTENVKILETNSIIQGDNNFLTELTETNRLEAKVQEFNGIDKPVWRKAQLIELANLSQLPHFSGYELSIKPKEETVEIEDMLRSKIVNDGENLGSTVLFKTGIRVRNDGSESQYNYIHANLPLFKEFGKDFSKQVVIRDGLEVRSSLIEGYLADIMDVPKPRYLHLPNIYNEKNIFIQKPTKAMKIQQLLHDYGVAPQALLSIVGSLGYCEEDSTLEMKRSDRLHQIFGSVPQKAAKFNVQKIRTDNNLFSLNDIGYTNKILNRNRLRIMNDDTQPEAKRTAQLNWFLDIMKRFLEEDAYIYFTKNMNVESKRIVNSLFPDIDLYNSLHTLNGLQINDVQARKDQIALFTDRDMKFYRELYQEMIQHFKLKEFSESNINLFFSEYAYRKALYDARGLIRGIKLMVAGKEFQLLSGAMYCEILGRNEFFERLGFFLKEHRQMEIQGENNYLRYLTKI